VSDARATPIQIRLDARGWEKYAESIGADSQPGANTLRPYDLRVSPRQIDATDRQIDRLVCELYGLTGEGWTFDVQGFQVIILDVLEANVTLWAAEQAGVS